MKRVLITTVRRNIPHTEPSGFIYVYDLEHQTIIQRCLMIEPPMRALDNNPRGGMRGSRGIAIRNNTLAIANASLIVFYDQHWNIENIITHPSMAAIHDVAFQGDTLWASSARNDLVFQFDLEGRLLYHLNVRDQAPILRPINWHPPQLLKSEDIVRGAVDFRDPRTHQEETYDRAHVNSVVISEDGELFISLGLLVGVKFAALLMIKNWMLKHKLWHKGLAVNRKIRDFLGFQKNVHSDLVVQPAKGHSAIIKLSPSRKCEMVSILPNMFVPSHSLMQLPDKTLIYLNTTEGRVMHYSTLTNNLLSSTKVADGFLRGVTMPNDLDQVLLLGSKGELIEFDLATLTVLSRNSISQDPNESIYDIKILPDHFDLPPISFIDNLKRQMDISDPEDMFSSIIHKYGR